MSGRIYDVGIHLTANDGVSGVLAAIGKSVLGLHGSVNELQHGLNALKLGAVGAVMGAAGVGLAHAVGHIEEAGEKLVHAQQVFAAGLPAAERASMLHQAAAAAWSEAGTNMNTTVTGNIEALHDLFNIVPHMDEAIKMLPAYNVMANTLQSVKDQGSLGEAASGKSAASAVRAFELSGKTNTDDIVKMSEALTKTFVSLRGAVDGSQYLQAIQGAGDARQMYGEKFATEGLPVLINIMKGRTGNLLSTLDRNLFSGVNNSNLQGMMQEKYGLHTEDDRLLDDKGKWQRGAYKVGTVFEADKLRSNPIEWSQDYRKHLADMGEDTGNTSKMTEIAESIGRGNKTLAALLGELLSPKTAQSIQREVDRRETVPDDAAQYLQANDPKAARAAMMKQYENAVEGIGQHLVQPMMDNIIKPLTVVLSNVAQWANMHPEAIKEIGVGLAALSAGLVAAGAVLVGGAILAALGTGGWLIAGLAALGAALAAFEWLRGAKPAGTADPGLHKDDDRGETFAELWTRRNNEINAGISSWWSSVTASLAAKFSGRNDEINAALGSMWTSLKDGVTSGVQGAGAAISAAVSQIGTGLNATLASLSDKAGAAVRQVGAALVAAFNLLPEQVMGAIRSIASTIGTTLQTTFSGIGDKASAAIHEIGAAFVSAIAALPGQVGGAISGAIGSIGSSIAGAFSHLNPFSGGGTPSPAPPTGGRQAPPSPPGAAGGRVHTGMLDGRMPDTHIYLDGKKIAHVVGKQMASAATYPHSVGGMDTHGTWAPPSASLVDAG